MERRDLVVLPPFDERTSSDDQYPILGLLARGRDTNPSSTCISRQSAVTRSPSTVPPNRGMMKLSEALFNRLCPLHQKAEWMTGVLHPNPSARPLG